MSALCSLRRSEGYEARDDEFSVFQAAEWETRGCVRTSESPWGCPKYYDNDNARACRAEREDGIPSRRTEKELQVCSA